MCCCSRPIRAGSAVEGPSPGPALPNEADCQACVASARPLYPYYMGKVEKVVEKELEKEQG